MGCPRLLLTFIFIMLACEYSIAKGRYTLHSLKKSAKELSTGNDHAKVGGVAKSGKAAADFSSRNENVVLVKQQDSYKSKTTTFVGEADEVANLMSKDYTVCDPPKKNPPINNHEPKY